MDRAELRPVPSSSAAPAPFRVRPAPAALAPASLAPAALAQRLLELCGDERNLQVEFLLHLMEFDDRRAYPGAGYASLRGGPRRTGGVPVKVETQRLVAAVREGEAAERTRGAAEVAPGPHNLSLLAGAPAVDAAPSEVDAALGPTSRSATDAAATASAGAPATATVAAAPVPGSRAAASACPVQRNELRPVGKDAWSLRVALDDAARAELLELAALTAHSTRGDLAAVLRDAVRTALAKHRKRRGAARSERKQKGGPATPASSWDATSAPATVAATEPSTVAPMTTTALSTVTPTAPDARAVLPSNEPAATSADGAPGRIDPRAVPTAVREAVWERDGGRCAWVSPEGKRCGSTWKVQLGHVRAVALGGQATVEDLRLECATHNEYEAIRVFGRRHMARFQPSLDSRRREQPR